MDGLSGIWIEQCDAARDIREAWGTNKALGYLIGEKFLNCLQASDSSSDWAEKIPLFTEEIKRIFTVDELHTYFATTRRVGSAAHVAADAEYEFMREAGVFDDDAISGAADAILFERARALLLGGARESQ
jgi:hypothetical protein